MDAQDYETKFEYLLPKAKFDVSAKLDNLTDADKHQIVMQHLIADTVVCITSDDTASFDVEHQLIVDLGKTLRRHFHVT